MVRLISIASVVLGSLVIVACGGSSGGGGGGEKALTKDEWIAKADAICAASKKAQDALPQPQSAADLAAMTEKLIPIITKEINDVNALPIDDANRAAVADMMGKAGVQIEMATGLAAVAKAGDMAKIQEFVTTNQSKMDAANSAAKAFGLKVCGGQSATG